MTSRSPINCYAARSCDDATRRMSSSGGVFTELARVVLSEGGVVFGAGWARDPLRVVHKWVDTEAGLEELRGSKYSVSDMSGVYRPMRAFLSSGRKVLFVGTPCQTAAIRKTFGEDENLLLCAIICMTNLEPSVLHKFVKDLERRHGSAVRNIRFRDKTNGWHYSCLAVEFEDASKNYSECFCTSRYFKLLESVPRKVCRRCAFRGGANGADLMIGDFWGIEHQFPELDDGKGVNAVLVYTDRGAMILRRAHLLKTPVRYEQILLGNPYVLRQYVPLPKVVKFLLRAVRFVFRHTRGILNSFNRTT